MRIIWRAVSLCSWSAAKSCSSWQKVHLTPRPRSMLSFIQDFTLSRLHFLGRTCRSRGGPWLGSAVWPASGPVRAGGGRGVGRRRGGVGGGGGGRGVGRARRGGGVGGGRRRLGRLRLLLAGAGVLLAAGERKHDQQRRGAYLRHGTVGCNRSPG